jgi:hypothetical protein
MDIPIMNLNRLNVQELSMEEQVNTEGGWWIVLMIFGIEIIGYDTNEGWTTSLW